jgi:MFS family permease
MAPPGGGGGGENKGTPPHARRRGPPTTGEDGQPGGPGRQTGLWPMFFLGGVNLVDHIDMSIVRGILPLLEDEWGLSDLQLGLLGFVFVFVNAIATIPAGWLADNFRRTRIIGWTMASWSGLLVLSATAVNYLNLVFARSIMGIGQSFDDPASTSLIGDYYEPHKRAKAFSLQQIALFLGSGLGVALGAFVGETFGWRWAFIIVGMPGSLLAFLAFRLPEPVRGHIDLQRAGMVSEPNAPLPYVAAREGIPLRQFVRTMARELGVELRFIFGIRTMRYILIGVSALLFTVMGVAFWLAVYHERFSDMSLSQAAAFTAVVLGIGGGIGTIAGGQLSDRLLVRYGPSSRIQIVVWTAVTCAVLFMISFAVQVVPVRLALQFVGVGFGAAAVPGLRAAMLDVVPANSRGVGASAFSLTSIIFGTALAPPLVGVLSDLTNSLVTAFFIVFPPVILGLMLLLRATKTIVEDADKMMAALLARQNEPSP